MRKALLTKKDIKNFIFDAIYEYCGNQLLCRKDFCEYFNITFPKLNKYLELGLPWIGKPTRKKFNVNECRKWFDEHRREL